MFLDPVRTRSKWKLQYRKQYSRYTLHNMVRNNMIDEIRTLIDRGVDVNSKKNESVGAIHLATKMGLNDTLKLLIEAGADVNLRDNNFQATPLHFTRNLSTMKILIQAGADVNARNHTGYHILHRAVMYNKVSVIKYLISSCKVDINPKTFYRMTPFHGACCPRFLVNGINLKTVKLLLNKNSDINNVTLDQKTPLISVLERGKPNNETKKLFRFLLKYSNVNFGNYINRVNVSNKEMFEIFLQHLAIIMSLGMPFYSCNHIFNKKPYYDDYFKKCNEELVLAKSTKIRDTWISFFNLLIDDKIKLKNYAGNEKLIDNFKNCKDFSDKFPIYGKQMQESVNKGVKRRELYDESCVLLSNNLPLINPTHLIIRDILDLVSTKNLTQFCMK